MTAATTPDERWRLGYRPALDGLRGVAVLLVMAAHLEIVTPGGGATGVTIFFALSGFLITALLLEELHHGRIDLRSFYRRRARRLLPALITFLIVIAAYWLVTRNPMVSPTYWPATLPYYANWQASAQGDLGALTHVWSLAVEEQFYLAWPVILAVGWKLAKGRATWILAAVVVGVGASMLWRLWLADGPVARVAFGTDTRGDALLIGCALALCIHMRGVPRVPTWLSAVSIATIGLVSLLPPERHLYVWGYSAAAIATAALIASSLDRPTRLLSGGPLTAIGLISYALYLWHYPIFLIGAGVIEPGVGRVAVLGGLSVLAALASWFLVERRWMNPRRRERVRVERGPWTKRIWRDPIPPAAPSPAISGERGASQPVATPPAVRPRRRVGWLRSTLGSR